MPASCKISHRTKPTVTAEHPTINDAVEENTSEFGSSRDSRCGGKGGERKEQSPLPLSEFLENSSEISEDLFLTSDILGKLGTVLGM